MRTLTIRSRARATRTAFVASLGAIALVAASCGAASASGSGPPPPGGGLLGGTGAEMSALGMPHMEWLRSDPTGTTSPDVTATNPAVTTLPAPVPGLVAGRVTVVGDSVTVDAQPALQALIPKCQVDAQVGEQWETGIAALQQLRDSGQLGSIVVVALGTNGPVSVSEFAQMMSVLHGVSRVVFVTDHAPDYWEEQNNAIFFAQVPHYATARIANWDAAAKANPSWLYSDGTHMPIGGPGAYAWARLVKAQI
ncbi:MAG: hypothetical protein ACLPQS_12600 [Acidimicrobiales bacterium]